MQTSMKKNPPKSQTDYSETKGSNHYTTDPNSPLNRTQPHASSQSKLDPAYAYYLDVSVPKAHHKVARVKSSYTNSSFRKAIGTINHASETIALGSFNTRRSSAQSCQIYNADSSIVPMHYTRVGPGSYTNDIVFGTHSKVSKYSNTPYFIMH